MPLCDVKMRFLDHTGPVSCSVVQHKGMWAIQLELIPQKHHPYQDVLSEDIHSTAMVVHSKDCACLRHLVPRYDKVEFFFKYWRFIGVLYWRLLLVNPFSAEENTNFDVRVCKGKPYTLNNNCVQPEEWRFVHTQKMDIRTHNNIAIFVIIKFFLIINILHIIW